MSTMDLQELLALGLVALVVGIALWRRFRHSRKPQAGCDGCGPQAKKPAESTLHFHRRKH